MPARPVHGLKKDVPDIRDLRYRADYLRISRHGQLMLSEVLPEVVDLRKEPNTPVWDQGDLGSCVEQALCTVMGHVASDQGGGVPVYSRLFAYYNARDGEPVDEGSSLREAIKGVDRHGIPLEVMWPYDLTKWKDKPPQEVWDAAILRHEIAYYRLLTKESMMMALAYDRKPWMVGLRIYSSFQIGADFAIPMPTVQDELRGGHAMTVMGYDRKREAFLVRNSWGDDWGDGGHCWIPFAYFHPPDPLVYAMSDSLLVDAWAIRKVTV